MLKLKLQNWVKLSTVDPTPYYYLHWKCIDIYLDKMENPKTIMTIILFDLKLHWHCTLAIMPGFKKIVNEELKVNKPKTI